MSAAVAKSLGHLARHFERCEKSSDARWLRAVRFVFSFLALRSFFFFRPVHDEFGLGSEVLSLLRSSSVVGAAATGVMLHEVPAMRDAAGDVKGAPSSKGAERRLLHAYSIDAILGLDKSPCGDERRRSPCPSSAAAVVYQAGTRCTSPACTDSGSETASNGTSHF